MNTMQRTLLSAFITITASACAGTGVMKMKPASPAKPVTELIGKPHDMGSLLDIPIAFRRGDTIPVSPAIRTPYIELKEKTVHLTVLQPFYILFTIGKKHLPAWQSASPTGKKKLLSHLRVFLSQDGRSWAPINRGDALKKVFGIRGGSISIGMNITADRGLAVTTDLATR